VVQRCEAEATEADWLPATVPGDVHRFFNILKRDLAMAKIIQRIVFIQISFCHGVLSFAERG